MTRVSQLQNLMLHLIYSTPARPPHALYGAIALVTKTPAKEVASVDVD